MSNYIPKHTASEYMEYQKKNDCSIRTLSKQEAETNHSSGARVEMFSEHSQHVDGRTIEECLDKAIAYKPPKYQPPKFVRDLMTKAFNCAIDEYLRKGGFVTGDGMGI